MPHFTGDLRYDLSLQDSAGSTTGASRTISLEEITIRKKREERRGDTVINRFSLILFDVGSSEITANNSSIIDVIKTYIKPHSKISVNGYTDRLGETEYNKQLSESRAQAVAATLNSPNISAHGAGQADLYDSALPEGRLYTRTVDIVIETPVSE